MTFGYRYRVEHSIYGDYTRCTTKAIALQTAQQLADRDDSEYIVIDMYGRKDRSREICRVMPSREKERKL